MTDIARRISQQTPTFTSTFNMGVEGFSKPKHMPEMNHFTGGNGELTYLFGFMLLFPILAYGRKENEDGIAKEIKSNNSYARLNLDAESSQPSKWTA